MKKYELLAPYGTKGVKAFFVVTPVNPRRVLDGDYVEILSDGKNSWLSDIDVKSQRDGRGTVLLHAAVAWANQMGKVNIGGSFVPATGRDIEIENWYKRRGIRVDAQNYLLGSVENILGICGVLLADWDISYSVLAG